MTSPLRAFAAAAILTSLLCPDASAQFYTGGADPARIKWFSISSKHYKVIYPEGADSLAGEYCRHLEGYRHPESASSGLTPGEGYRRRTPVILHTGHGISNGVVTWAPRRADLYTLPDAYNPEPMPWIKTLAIHEGRHLAQMQFGYRGWLRPLTFVLGDMAVGAYSAIWPGNWLLEGDAVVAETALTAYGRGRSADFLEYYKAAFDSGDWRNWYRWRYGSYRHYAPDYYALGYMTVGGARYLYDDAGFTERYFDNITSAPLTFFNTQKTLRQASGKRFRESFPEIMETFRDHWAAGDAVREPFTVTEQVQTGDRWYKEMNGGIWCGGRLYSVCSGLATPAMLTEYDPETGKVRNVRAFASYVSRLKASGGRLWWSESVSDDRWELSMTSRIRYYDISSGRTSSLTRKGRLFNPEPSADGRRIAAVSFPVNGGSEIVMLDADSGRISARRAMPDSLQAFEVCFVGGDIAVSTISDHGSGLFLLCGGIEGELRCLSEPLPVSIRNISGDGSKLLFTSDRDGTQELYSIDTTTGDVRQLTSLKYGGDNFCRMGDYFYFTALSTSGKLLHRIRIDALEDKSVDFRNIHKYEIAEKLSQQERRLAADKGIDRTDDSLPVVTEVSAPERYRKVPHLFRFHSWAPVYFNYDNLSELSGDYTYEQASAGATALFQNSLGTAWGFVGYSFHEDPNRSVYRAAGKEAGHRYRHSGHLSFTYTGLYPVFELKADLNDRAAIQYRRRTVIGEDGKSTERVYGSLLSRPYISGELKAYIPLNFSSGGWRRGLIPQITYSVSNDLFDKTAVDISYDGNFFGSNGLAHFLGYTEGDNVFMHRVKASVRGYVMRPAASSGIYPRLGVGAEMGWDSRASLSDLYSSSGYSYIYGYLPGLSRTQGLRLTGILQHRYDADIVRSAAVNITPRGFSGSGAESFVTSLYPDQLRLTADYAIPIWVGDISCFSPFFYIKNFELTPHFDYTLLSGGGLSTGELYSAGATIAVHLANLLWVPYDCTIGLSLDWNGGRTCSAMKKAGYEADSPHIGFVFNIDL